MRFLNKKVMYYSKKFFSTNNLYYIKEKKLRLGQEYKFLRSNKEGVTSNLMVDKHSSLNKASNKLSKANKRNGIKQNIKENFSKTFIKKKALKKGLYILYIRSSLRGLHVNISDANGRVLKVFTLGLFGYTKAKRYNIISLRALSKEVLNSLRNLKPKLGKLVIYLKGFNSKRNNIMYFLLKSPVLRFKVSSIIDLSDVPYNGCRPKKLRRK